MLSLSERMRKTTYNSTRLQIPGWTDVEHAGTVHLHITIVIVVVDFAKESSSVIESNFGMTIGLMVDTVLLNGVMLLATS